MKAETWIFAITTIFLVLVTPAYWFITGAGETGADWTGTSALTMTCLLYTSDAAGELGFFPPYSWWPLWAAATLGVMVFGLAMAAWWLFIIGGVLGTLALCGLVFEYYRGEHAH